MKVKYKIDENNQLIITRGKIRLNPDGKFSIDGHNQLTYEIAESTSWRKENNLPQKITFKGTWNIDKDHNFIFTLRKTETQEGGERLLLNTELLDVKANALIISCGTKGKRGTHAIRLLQLKGKWKADKHNRLQFLVKKLKNRTDPLTFQGDWEVKHNALIYTYRKTSLITKTKHTYTLRFKGYWEVNKRNRLTYILDTKNDSYFDFRVYLETPNLIGKRGTIKYRIGIGIKGDRLFKREIIALYGVWKFHRKTGLSYDMDYGDGRIKAIRFGAFVRVKERSKITLVLRNREGKNLGISVTFNMRFLKNSAEWFLRIVKEGKQPRFEWGVTIPW